MLSFAESSRTWRYADEGRQRRPVFFTFVPDYEGSHPQLEACVSKAMTDATKPSGPTFVVDEFVGGLWTTRLTTRDREKAVLLVATIKAQGGTARLLEFEQ